MFEQLIITMRQQLRCCNSYGASTAMVLLRLLLRSTAAPTAAFDKEPMRGILMKGPDGESKWKVKVGGQN